MIQNLNIESFLKNYWQKKPLLIRQAFPNYKTPITKEELAGLACEEFVESRIIEEDLTLNKFKVEHGPFIESKFTSMPEKHWTLLIQGVNKIFPAVDDLLHKFDFIPQWRVDDIMASYATPQGSVGPHMDNYDVFLLQVSGKRKWMIDNKTQYKFNPNSSTNIIEDFIAKEEWVLEAGDMLYLPPNVAHYGIGIEECITFSIGFRAPSYAELISAYIDDNIAQLKDNLRYRDPKLCISQNSGEINNNEINEVQKVLLSFFNDKSKIADWFGHFITEYNHDEENLSQNSMTTSEFIAAIENSAEIKRPATVRANYIISNTGNLSLYINGTKEIVHTSSYEMIKIYCNHYKYNYSNINKILSENNTLELFRRLYNKGYLDIING